MIRLFVQNNSAILDSLTKFESLKRDTPIFKTETRTCLADNKTLKSQNMLLLIDKGVLSNDLAVIRPKLTKARKENWFWRIAAASTVYYLFSTILK